jgi:hypothetical protein
MVKWVRVRRIFHSPIAVIIDRFAGDRQLFWVYGRYSVDTGLVVKVLEPNSATKTMAAQCVREIIEDVLDYTRADGHRTGKNPAPERASREFARQA